MTCHGLCGSHLPCGRHLCLRPSGPCTWCPRCLGATRGAELLPTDAPSSFIQNLEAAKVSLTR